VPEVERPVADGQENVWKVGAPSEADDRAAMRLADLLCEVGVVARFGGDEFNLEVACQGCWNRTVLNVALGLIVAYPGFVHVLSPRPACTFLSKCRSGSFPDQLVVLLLFSAFILVPLSLSVA
jgi:hypothetical protein